jgi:protein phosphatase
MLTRTLGLSRFVSIDEISIDLMPGDRLLLCTDGLTEMVPDNVIAKALGDGAPEEVAWELVELANDAGGVDNISVVVLDVLD